MGRKRYKIKNDDELKNLMREFNNTTVAKKIGVTRECIRQYRKKYNIKKPRIKTYCRKKPTIINEDNFPIILQDLKAGKHPNDIIKEFDMSINTFYWYVKKNGFSIKDFPYKRKNFAKGQIKNEEQYLQALTLLDMGMRPFEVAKETGAFYQTVIHWKNKHFRKGEI